MRKQDVKAEIGFVILHYQVLCKVKHWLVLLPIEAHIDYGKLAIIVVDQCIA